MSENEISLRKLSGGTVHAQLHTPLTQSTMM